MAIKKIIFYSNFVKYFIISLICLILDLAVYLSFYLLNFFSQEISASIGYIFGLLVAYLIYRKTIFYDGWLHNNIKYEFLIYILSGILGILITYFTVYLYRTSFGEEHFAKFIAVSLSFISVYFLRRFIVFKK